MDSTSKTSQELERDEHGRLLPGQRSLNPNGRPKGTSMKEYARQWLLNMTPEAKDEWLSKLSPDLIWRMSEGNPRQDTDITTDGRPIVMVAPEVALKNAINSSAEPNS